MTSICQLVSDLVKQVVTVKRGLPVGVTSSRITLSLAHSVSSRSRARAVEIIPKYF